MSIYIKNISKSFDDVKVLDDIKLNIRSGELIGLLGPSGSGKTTLLRIIAGLEQPDSGEIYVHNENALLKPLKDREVGFVFQHYALFRHMNIFDNVAFGLKVRPKQTRPSNEAIEKTVKNLLKLVNLENFIHSYPNHLSGGQRQRVALARSLAVEPQILLLDEPFGALDSKVRQQLRRWMRKLHDEIPITTIFVTHDQEEAMEVSDRVVVMSNGQLEQIGTPEEIYHSPKNAFVYDFLGNFNVFDGYKDELGNPIIDDYDGSDQNLQEKIKETISYEIDWLNKESVAVNSIKKILPKFLVKRLVKKQITKNRQARKDGKRPKVKIFARPHEMEISKKPLSGDFIEGQISHINQAGALVKIECERKNGQIIQIEIPKENFDVLELKKFDVVYVKPNNVRIFE